MAQLPFGMHRSTFSLFLSAIVVLSLVFYHIHQLRVEIGMVHHRIFASLRDLETKAVVADQYLEQRVADNLRRVQNSQLEREKGIIQNKALAAAEQKIMEKIKEMAGSFDDRKRNSELNVLAFVKDYVHNFITNEIPIDVKKWFTLVSKQAHQICTLNHDDPVLIKYIREQLLIQPSAKQAPSQPKKGNYSDEITELLGILKNKTNGTFVEIGNHFNRSLILETDFSWNGMLIEKDPDNVKDLLDKSRKSWIAPTCISRKATPELVPFGPATKKGAKELEMLCMPFEALCLAMNITKLDYLHLNVKGNELEAFKKIDYDKIRIRVVEIGSNVEKSEIDAIKNKLLESNYRLHNLTVKADDRLIFVKKM
ncbi:uncharacterized protein LOC135942307 [Cloeon dipterum]|uniref:uncharacterized protein LOC135942307 n=1 Tax=Cloeon dipterum TaxID=197152 RepID=UPI00321F9402